MRSLLTIAVLTGLALPLAAQQPRTTGGAVSGVVVDATGGQPISTAVVTVSRIEPADGFPRRFITDTKGRFIFGGLPPADDYILSARASGYLGANYGESEPSDSVSLNQVTRVPIVNGRWVQDLKISLFRPPSISGRVVDEAGEPMIGVAVRAFAVMPIAGHDRLVGGPLATTDDRGMYVMTGIEPGEYMVSVLSVQSTVPDSVEERPIDRPIGGIVNGAVGAGYGAFVTAPGVDVDAKHRLAITNFGTPPPPSADRPRAYAAVFYPSSRGFSNAERIDVGYGRSRSGVDFMLQPEPAFHVHGHAEGAVSPGLLLRLMPTGSEGLGFGSEAATTTLEKDGSFTFLNVPAGAYTLIAQSSVTDLTRGDPGIRVPDAPGFPGGGAAVGTYNTNVQFLHHYGAGATVWGRSQVSVGGGHQSDVTLTLRPLPKITGRIVFADGAAPPSPARGIRLTIDEADGDPLSGYLGDPQAQPQGLTYRFSIDVMPGSYLITGATGYRVASVTLGGRDVTSSPIDVSDGQDSGEVVITLTDKARPVVKGTVAQSANQPVVVMAFPADRQRWTNYGFDATGFRQARTDSAGGFSVQGLAAGEYFLIAVDSGEYERRLDPKFLAAATPFATRVKLEWGGTTSVSLAVQRVGK